MSNTPLASRGRQSHAFLAAREARHQRGLEYQRVQAPLNESVNQTDLDTNSTQTTPLKQNSSNGISSSYYSYRNSSGYYSYGYYS